MKRRLDLSDIQGNVLRPFRFGHGWHQFVRIEHAAGGRAWLGRLVEHFVSDATARKDSKPTPDTGVHVAISAAGMAALGMPPQILAQFSPEFRVGMAARADVLGDRGRSDPRFWRPGFGPIGPVRPDNPPPALAVVSAYGTTDDDRDWLKARLREESDQSGVSEVQDLDVQRFKDEREHFGFADGFAQPEVEGAPPSPRAPLRGKPLPAGEFLIGHRDVEYAIAPGPAGPLGRNGTYMVYRELAQDVDGFQQYVEAQAELTGLDPEFVKAKMVGRWPDGSPLVVTPDAPDPSLVGDGTPNPRINDFTFADDPDGALCPLGAHIRRVNPRDALGVGDLKNGAPRKIRRDMGERMSRRHRMIRRGMPYGPKFDDDPRQERGLAFICFVASIQRQFEFVQAQWCNDGNPFGLGLERDALVGQGVRVGDDAVGSKFTVPGSPSGRPSFLSPAPEVVHTRGGEYFFLPSISGLKMMSESRWY